MGLQSESRGAGGHRFVSIYRELSQKAVQSIVQHQRKEKYHKIAAAAMAAVPSVVIEPEDSKDTPAKIAQPHKERKTIGACTISSGCEAFPFLPCARILFLPRSVLWVCI
jgi:hypothetical protein